MGKVQAQQEKRSNWISVKKICPCAKVVRARRIGFLPIRAGAERPGCEGGAVRLLCGCEAVTGRDGEPLGVPLTRSRPGP